MTKMQTLKNKLCKCDNHENTIQCQKITINRSDLKLYIKEYDDIQDTKKSWHLPLTVLISLVIALATTSFQESVAIPISEYKIQIPDGMSLVLWAATIVFIIWTARAILRSIKTKNPIELLLRNIDTSILNKPDRTSIFIIKRNKDNKNELLVEKKGSWACYLLPYVKQSALTEYTSNQKEGTTKSLGDKLGTDTKDIKIELLQEFNFKSEKFDPPQNVVKEYHFEVFHVKISNDSLKKDSFTVGDREYYWKTLNELEEDPNTKRNNKDIINHLRDNYNDLISNVSSYND